MEPYRKTLHPKTFTATQYLISKIPLWIILMAEASPGIFSGDGGWTPGPHKGYHAAHAGGPGGVRPRMVTKFKFFND